MCLDVTFWHLRPLMWKDNVIRTAQSLRLLFFNIAEKNLTEMFELFFWDSFNKNYHAAVWFSQLCFSEIHPVFYHVQRFFSHHTDASCPTWSEFLPENSGTKCCMPHFLTVFRLLYNNSCIINLDIIIIFSSSAWVAELHYLSPCSPSHAPRVLWPLSWFVSGCRSVRALSGGRVSTPASSDISAINICRIFPQ